MKQTYDYYQQNELDQLLGLLSQKDKLLEKTRINVYLPKIIVKLMDSLAKKSSRGEFVTSLIVKEIKKSKKMPFGMFSPLEISEKDIEEVSSSWAKNVKNLT